MASSRRLRQRRTGSGDFEEDDPPVFDRLGGHQKVWVGYRGTMNLVFEVANLFQSTATEAQKLAHN